MRILVVDDHELIRRGICTVLATEPLTHGLRPGS